MRKEFNKLKEKFVASLVSLLCCGSISFGWPFIEPIVFRLSARLLIVLRLFRVVGVLFVEDVVTSVSGRFMDWMVVGRAGDAFDTGDVVNGELSVVGRLLAAATGRLLVSGVDDSGVESEVGIGRLIGAV